MTPRRMLRLIVPPVAIVAAVVAIRQFAGGDTVERDGLTFASGALSGALEAPGGSSEVRLLASFTDSERVPCRAFVAAELSGIACRERGGWHLRVIRPGVALGDPGALAATERSLRVAAAQMAAQ